MKTLTQKLKHWRSHHSALADDDQSPMLLRNHHAGQALMAQQVLEALPGDWTVYQLERVRIVDVTKQTDSLGLFFELEEALEALNRHQQKRQRKGFRLTHRSDDGQEVDLIRTNDQGKDVEISLTIKPLSVL